MAKKPAASLMKEHERTYQGFLTLTKLSVIALAITMIALYCLIVVGQVILGWVILLVVMPAAVMFNFVSGARS